MADKPIEELIEAVQVTQTDLFVLQQNNTAKKLSGQTLINYLLKMIDGHGGIQSIVKSNTSGLVDTYTVTMADTTTSSFSVTNGRAISSIKETAANGLTRTYTIAFNDGSTEAFTVTDGRSITNISKTGTDGLADTYTIAYNDGSTGKYTVTNGAQGEKGDTTYIWIKFASQEPTESSHSFGDVPDNWIGFYVGSAGVAPTDWMQYQWFKIKGEQGEQGDPAMLVSSVVTYQAGNSGTIIPSGTWSSDIPVVSQGKYLWTREVTQFNTGDPITKYSVSRMGIDGLGSVVSVCGVDPDENGNVALDASHVGALSLDGGNMLGPLNMNGQPLRGLNEPTENTAAANKGYVDKAASRASSPRNLLDNSDFRNPVNQRGITASSGRDVYTFDRWLIDSSGGNGCWDVKPNEGCGLNVNGDNWMTFVQKVAGLDRTKPYTIAFQDGNGTIHVNESADIQWDGDLAVARIILHTGAMTVVWAALYEGEYTAETLPEYQPKGYAVELMECLRYYRRKYSVVGNGNSGYAAVNFEIPMRVVPTVSILSTNNGAADYYEAHHEYMAVQNVTGILNLILYEASADL